MATLAVHSGIYTRSSVSGVRATSQRSSSRYDLRWGLELEFEAFVYAVQLGMKMLEGNGGFGKFGREGVTEMHVAVYVFVEQVLGANGKMK